MNAYDFDGTIYDGDSSVDLWLFCIRKKPSVFLKCLPKLAGGAALYALKRIPKERWKEHFFSFLNDMPADKELVADFWEEHYRKIKPWYLEQKKDSDLVISASPVFLLRPVCRRLGVSLIATEVDPATGRISGRNCSGEEKVRRFRREYPGSPVEAFYTDSYKDTPMAMIAEKSFFVRKNTIRDFRPKR